MSFIDKIDKHCDQHKIRQSRFEREAGLSKGLISRWRRGTVPRIDSLEKAAKYMKISLDDLISPDPEDIISSEPYQDNWTSGPDVVRDSQLRYIPVYRYLAEDGESADIQDIVMHYAVFSDNLSSAEECFGLIIQDTSMSPDIEPGDVAIVRKDSEPDSGDIVIVSSPGEGTICRKLIRSEGYVILQPFSRHFTPIVYRTEEIDFLPVLFIGKVVTLIRMIGSSSNSVPEL